MSVSVPGSRRWHPAAAAGSRTGRGTPRTAATTASRNPARTVSTTSGCASSGTASRATSSTAARPLSPDPRLVAVAIAPMKSSSAIGATPSSPPVAATYVRLPLTSTPVAIGIDAARIAGSNAGATSVDARSAVSTKRGLAGSRSRSSKSSVTSGSRRAGWPAFAGLSGSISGVAGRAPSKCSSTIRERAGPGRPGPAPARRLAGPTQAKRRPSTSPGPSAVSTRSPAPVGSVMEEVAASVGCTRAMYARRPPLSKKPRTASVRYEGGSASNETPCHRAKSEKLVTRWGAVGPRLARPTKPTVLVATASIAGGRRISSITMSGVRWSAMVRLL